MNNAVFFFGIALLAFISGLFWLGPGRDAYPQAVRVGSQTFTLEVASTVNERRQGLGGRAHLCDSCAMLFVFEATDTHAFWMKDMRFPLDIAWLSGDTVVWIERRIQPHSLATYRPETPSDRVLEFNAGAIDGVQRGDRVQFVLPKE